MNQKKAVESIGSRVRPGAAAALLAALLTALAPATIAADATESAQSPIPRVDRQLLLGFLADNTTMTLIDARSPEEYAELHLPEALNIPFDAVEAHSALLPTDKLNPVVVYCRTGRRAGLLKEQLIARGYTNVQVLPREQIFWEDDFMAFNCSTGAGDTTTGKTIQPESTDEQN